MIFSVCLVLLLLGSWATVAALIAGDRLRREGTSILPRVTPRVGTALALLALAGVAGVVSVAQQPAAATFPHYVTLGLLFLGTGVTLAALTRAAPPQADGLSQPRITNQGWTALALLGSAQVAGMVNHRAVEAVQHVPAQAAGHSPVWGLIGLLCLASGTCAAATTFLARRPPGDDSVAGMVPLNPRSWWALALLGVALALLGLDTLAAPTPGGFFSLVLALLGVGAAVFGRVADAREKSEERSAILRISPRGWISLGLLTLAIVVLAGQQTLALTSRTGPTAEAESQLAQLRAEVDQKQAALDALTSHGRDESAWMRPAAGSAASGDRTAQQVTRLENEVAALRERLAQSEAARTRGPSNPSALPPSVRMDDWNWHSGAAGQPNSADPTAAERARLEQELAGLKTKLAQMEADLKGRSNSASVSTPANGTSKEPAGRGEQGTPPGGAALKAPKGMSQARD
jgi:hypothetical protein